MRAPNSMFELDPRIDRIRTSLVCLCFLIFTCLCHISTSDTSSDEMDALSNVNQFSDDSGMTTAVQRYRQPKTYRRGYHEDYDDHDDHGMGNKENSDMKAMVQPKVDYWGGYYDFLINEGSYKFWAVFQLATAALLIYSGFAALYYAKINPPATDDEFDDILRRRRRRRSLPIAAQDRLFCGLDSATFQRILDAVAKEIH